MSFQPENLYVESAATGYPVTKSIIEKLGFIDPVIVDSVKDVPQNRGHQSLVLAEQKADFYKNCPGTHNYICCGYRILNLVNNCEIGCTYCVLQGYLESPHIVVYVNKDDMFDELERLLKSHPDHQFRIGTGELADSLSTDHLTEYSRELVRFFADKRNAIIELKTKTVQIDNFLNEDHGGRTVVSWSLNTPRMIATEESHAPGLEARLSAARECEKKGFKIGFHFDPMIYYPEWENDYHETVDKIFEYIKPDSIIWISLGALRYPPHLDQIIRENHPESKIVYGELFPGIDGKMRYFKAIRIDMFRKMHAWLKSHDRDLFIYLCMSSSEIWQKSFGWSPENSGGLKKIMDRLILH
ncbi:MAG: hypothetical protein V2J62_11775 [candidate division KSB1 bacterium]|jgi:spore photoproduct lyase|nr:hypothetical protein [candidate division KSB1 bacterium]